MILGHWLSISLPHHDHHDHHLLSWVYHGFYDHDLVSLADDHVATPLQCQVSQVPGQPLPKPLCSPIIITSTYICITKFTKTLPYSWSWSSKDHPYDRAFETETEWICVESVILVVETETRPQPRGHWHRSVATAPELWCTVTHFPEMTRDLIFLTTELISSMMTNGNNDKDDEYECVRWESHVVPRATKA